MSQSQRSLAAGEEILGFPLSCPVGSYGCDVICVCFMHHACRSLNHCLPLLAMFPCGVACRFVFGWRVYSFVMVCVVCLFLLFRRVCWYFVTVGLVCWARPARAIFCLSVGAVFFDLNRSVLDRSVCGSVLEYFHVVSVFRHNSFDERFCISPCI